MFVRDKIKYLVDEDSIEIEDGVFARCNDEQFLPADAVVTLVAKINDRQVAIIANDMTVKLGTWGVRTIRNNAYAGIGGKKKNPFNIYD